MRDIESGALELVDGALGARRPATLTRPTSWDDETLQQVLDTGPLIARGTAADLHAGREGIFGCAFMNSHAGAGTQTRNSAIDPWLGVDSGQHVTEPLPTAAQFAQLDIWLLNASLYRLTGDENDLTMGNLQITFGTPSIPRFRAHDTGADPGAAANSNGVVAVWTSLIDPDETTAGFTSALTPDNRTIVRLGMRLPRGAGLIFNSVAIDPAGSAVFICFVECAAVPRGLPCPDAL